MKIPNKCLVIDIGIRQIKVAEILRKGEQLRVLDFFMTDTPLNAVSDGVILEKEAVSSAISEGIRKNKIKTRHVVFTVKSTKIITREVDLPFMKKDKLRSIISINAEEYFPVNLSDYILDYSIIETLMVNNDKVVRVIVAAALSDMIEQYVAVAELSGLKIAGIDYAGNSLSKILKRENFEGSNIILEIGSDSTMVSIIENNVVKFNRNLLFGSSLIIDCIKNHFEVEHDEAVRIWKERPLLQMDTNDNPYLKNDIQGAVNQILSGISRLVDYYVSRNAVDFRNIYVIGGVSASFGLEAVIENYFNIKVKNIGRFKGVVYKGRKDEKQLHLFFGNVFGAALSDINLIPQSLMLRKEKTAKNRSAVFMLFMLIVPMILYTGLKFYDIEQLNQNKRILEESIAKAQEIEVIKAEYNLVNEQLIFRKSAVSLTETTASGFKEVIEAMELTMPFEAFYMTLSNSETGIIIDCVAKDKLTAARLIEALKSQGFTNVYIPALSESEGETLEESSVIFTISMDYPIGEEGQDE